MHEQAFRFGRAGHLVGVTGWPASQRADTGVIVLNAGMVHHIGPFRLHVELTRRLNDRGYPSLRFDLSTLGDSHASAERQTPQQQVQSDVDDAMELLRKEAGCQHFILIGLCSGAVNAHVAARGNPRVVGAVFLDGYIYRTPGYYLRRYLPRILDFGRWTRFLARKHGSAHIAPGPDDELDVLDDPPRSQVRSELAAMLARGMKLCFIYSGGLSEYFNHLRQFRECFGHIAAHPDVNVDFLAEADHTYTLTGDRKMLQDAIEDWVTQNFPVDKASRAA